METLFGLYPRFYAKRKDQLFPLIEKYSGEYIKKGEVHKNIIQRYFALLRDNPEFKAEVDALIASQSDKLMKSKEKQALNFEQKTMNEGEKQIKNSGNGQSSGYKSRYQNAADPVTAIAEGIGSIFDFANTKAEANATAEAQFMEAVLNEQKSNDTGKILAVTGVTLAFVGLGVYLVLKLKK